MNQHHDIKKNVLAKIEKLEMHSSAYFAFRIGIFALFAILAVLCSVLIFNFISFSIRVSGQNHLLGFGPRGFMFFFEMFPWALVVLDIVFVIAAERALRYFRFGYRNPTLVLVGALLIISIGLGLVLDHETPLNDRLLVHSLRHELGPLGSMYDQARRPGTPAGGVCRCVIASVSDQQVIAYDIYASTTAITLQLPPGFATSTLHEGETVFIAGDRADDRFVIFGLHAIDDADSDDMPYRPMPKTLAPTR